MAPAEAPTPIRRVDYKPLSWRTTTVSLDFHLGA